MSAAHDFDFLLNDWRVLHRKLATRLEGASDWYEFNGTCEARPILDDTANFDENFLNDPKGAYHASSLRVFDPSENVWRIWWLDLRFPNRLDVPVIGSFDGDNGLFIADDTWRGKPLKVRFSWQKDAGQGPRWEQAMSLDDGANWETNWVMDFRIREAE